MLTWPDETTPWYALEQVQECYARIIQTILKYEKVLVVTADANAAGAILMNQGVDTSSVQFIECPINDTWARDHGFISLVDDCGHRRLLDYRFNGWGEKFEADLDNGVIRNLTTGAEYKTAPFPEFIQKIIENGGLMQSIADGAVS